MPWASQGTTVSTAIVLTRSYRNNLHFSIWKLVLLQAPDAVASLSANVSAAALPLAARFATASRRLNNTAACRARKQPVNITKPLHMHHAPGSVQRHYLTTIGIPIIKARGSHDRVTYDGVKSSLGSIKCGVPQGSILGPLLFLLYINDLSFVCKYTFPVLFADDTNLFLSGTDVSSLSQMMTSELGKISEWLKVNKLSRNTKKTHYIVFSGGKKATKCFRYQNWQPGDITSIKDKVSRCCDW